MYITCKQCGTIYRLDETLLKPSGSKVRCSQCHYVFIVEPPETEAAEIDQPGVGGEPVNHHQDTFDQELEGINIAELDSILEQGRAADESAVPKDRVDVDEVDELVEFNEADLDMDFESALDQDEFVPASADDVSESSNQVMGSSPDEGIEDLDLDIDLDMDFDLDDGNEVFAQPSISEDDAFDADLDMDFNLEDGEDTQVSDGDDIDDVTDVTVDVEKDEDLILDEDVELALDDFEDVLGEVVDPEAQDLEELEPLEEEVGLGVASDVDLGVDNDTTSTALEAQDSDLNLSELDSLLDEEVDDSSVDGSEPEAAKTTSLQADIDDRDLAGIDDLLGVDEKPDDTAVFKGEKLDLDDDLELSLDDQAVSDDVLDGAETKITAQEAQGDDLDLAGLDDLFDEDEVPVDAAVSEDEQLSLDDDLELSLDDQAVSDDVLDGAETKIAAQEAQGDDLDLAGLDDLFDEDEVPVDAAVSEDELLSLDDDLELSLDDQAVSDDLLDGAETKNAAQEAQGDDLDLAGLDDLFDEDEVPVDAAVSEDEQLSLDEDLELSLDEETVSVDAQADDLDLAVLDELIDEDEERVEGAVSKGDELSLDDDLELSLDEEPEIEASVTPAVTADQTDPDEFDLSEFEDLLDEEQSAEKTQDDDIELKLDDDVELKLDDDVDLDDALELELDSEFSEDPVSSEQDTDDLDLSGLEDTLLDEDEFEATEAVSAETGELEDLEFELDAEFGDKPIATTDELSQEALQDTASVGDSADEALDLSDIEKMLEDDTIVPDTSGTTQGLVMDSESDEGQQLDGEIGDDLGLEGDEIDLSDIEEAINAAEQDDQDAPFIDDGQEQELEFDIDDKESKEAAASDEFELELEMEDLSTLAPEQQKGDESGTLDLSDLDLSMEDDKLASETDTIDGGDIQLEFNIEDNGLELEDEDRAAPKTTAAASVTSGFMQEEKDFGVEETIATDPIQEQPAAPEVAEKTPKKKGVNKPMLVLMLLLLLLIAGGYFGYDYVVKNDIQIPYISDFINPEAKDPRGINRLDTMEINSKFIENEVEGRLFVVTGKVRNGYSMSRKQIRLKGKLYTKGKVLVKTELSYAGLVMADQELSSKPLSQIKKSLNSTVGQDAAITVAAGNSAPFMVVFSKLPDDLDEFVIELVSSSKAQ